MTLDRLCNDKFAICSRCDVARSRLLDMVSNGYKEATDDYMNLLQVCKKLRFTHCGMFTRLQVEVPILSY